MEINALLVNFQAAIYKILLLAKFSKTTTIYRIERFDLHYKEVALFQIFLLIIRTTLLLLKALEKSCTVTKLTKVC